MSGTDTNVAPYDESGLLDLAEQVVRRHGVPPRWREDAVGEFVCAAYQAGLNPGGRDNVQAYQRDAGRGAIANFLRRERRQERLAPAACAKGAARVSLSAVRFDHDEDTATVEETLVDPDTPAPEASMRQHDRDTAVAGGLAWLHPGQRALLRLVWQEGCSERAAAALLGVTRREVQAALRSIREFLRSYLAEYRNEYRGVRRAG